jgi:hypothetical protein
VRIENVTSVPQIDGTGAESIVDKFGHMVMMGSNLQVGDKLYFRSYDTNFCYKAPAYPTATQVFTSVDGIVYIDFCTWSMVPNDKCADLAPPSPLATDCNNDAMACAGK